MNTNLQSKNCGGNQSASGEPGVMPIAPALFSCSPIPNGVSVIAVAASKDQSLALANMWYHSRAVGTFRQFVTKESSELRVLGATLAAVQGALAGVTVESLLPYVKAIEQSRDDAQIKANEDKELNVGADSKLSHRAD